MHAHPLAAQSIKINLLACGVVVGSEGSLKSRERKTRHQQSLYIDVPVGKMKKYGFNMDANASLTTDIGEAKLCHSKWHRSQVKL